MGVLFSLVAGSAWADEVVLKGTVGTHPVVMQFDASPDGATGNYFYVKFKQDIVLQGSAGKDKVDLSSESTGDHFVLSRGGDGYTGTFTTAKGVKLPVTLARVAHGSVPEPQPDLAFRQPLSDYARLRLADVKFVDGRKETVGKYTIQWYSEPLSKLEMFRVVDGYPEAVAKGINRVVARDFYAALDGYFSCGSGENSGSGAEIKVSSRVLTDRLAGYAVSSSWSCSGTAHPSMGVDGTAVDARTGKELGLDDLWWLGSGARPAPMSDAWFKYRNEVFGPAVVALFKRLYPDHMKPAGDDGCDYSDAGPWSTTSWYLTDKGLFLSPDFEGAARACADVDWSLVPYSELKKSNPALFGD
ncbi:MAG: hypothetical protein P4L83_25010 [Nevskia sp.]|nr:hypothetical protein [Nevskia sp.]